jgi:hypothetical protein
MSRVFMPPRSIAAGLAAGITGGILLGAFLVFAYGTVLATPGFSLSGMLTFDASVLIGPAALTAPYAPALGACLHVLVSIGWALGYAWLAIRQPQLVTRPALSGGAFGFCIYFAMQLVLVAAAQYHQPTPAELGLALLGHVAFYGIPVAYVIARIAR